MIKCAIYARVSTKGDCGNCGKALKLVALEPSGKPNYAPCRHCGSTEVAGQDTENQLAQLREFSQRQGWQAREFLDYETGKHSDRAQLQAVFLAASRREIDVVLFWSLDRFTREGALATLKHLETLSSYGVGFRSFTEQYLDSCGIFKDAIIAILGTIAKQERIRISERTKAGLDRARRQGKCGGRPPKLFRRDRALELRGQGMSWRAIGRELKIPQSTIRKALKSYAPTA